MKVSENDAYDRETIMLLRTALNAAWDRLRIRTLMSAVAPS
jgi:hypothetical protein